MVNIDVIGKREREKEREQVGKGLEKKKRYISGLIC